MAGGQERVLKRRIKSVQSTRKTTRAMELIAGSRIVKAQARIVAARPYSEGLDRLAANVANTPGAESHPLVGPLDPAKGVALVVIAGDRGLSGPYNASVLRQAENVISERGGVGPAPQVVAVGKRAQSYLRFRGQRVDHLFAGMTDRPTWENATEIASSVLSSFRAGDVAGAEIVSMRYVSAGVQKVERRVLFPLDPEGGHAFDYETEPSVDELIERLLPRLIEARIFQALLEASASEHAARQRAMKAATDNADQLITNLRRVMNRARQDAITTEIMDIVGGAEALRHSSGSPLPSLPDAASRGAA